jgi:hypothetical protein
VLEREGLIDRHVKYPVTATWVGLDECVKRIVKAKAMEERLEYPIVIHQPQYLSRSPPPRQ